MKNMTSTDAWEGGQFRWEQRHPARTVERMLGTPRRWLGGNLVCEGECRQVRVKKALYRPREEPELAHCGKESYRHHSGQVQGRILK